MDTAIPIGDDVEMRRGQINRAAADNRLSFKFDSLLTDTVQRAVKGSVIDGDRLILEETIGQGDYSGSLINPCACSNAYCRLASPRLKAAIRRTRWCSWLCC